ncbi:MAG: glycosyltransferase family 2 protein [Phycisphaerae bacterium]
MSVARLDIVVCAHNDAAHLPRLLHSLRQQTAGLDTFRLLLIDNASTDATARVFRQHSAGLHATYVHEPRKGLNYARNTGYGHATSDYVAHTDADAIVDRRWVAAIRRAIDTRRPDLLGGPYYPYFVHPRPPWYRDAYNCVNLGAEPRPLRPGEFFSGINMIWRRATVERLGGFHAQLGLVGRQMARGDETDLMLRARSSNEPFETWYDPAIAVYHLTRPEAMRLSYWLRRSYAQGLRHYDIWPAHARPTGTTRAVRIARTGLRLARELAAAAAPRSQREPAGRWQNHIYERVLPQLYTLGRLVAAGRSAATR